MGTRATGTHDASSSAAARWRSPRPGAALLAVALIIAGGAALSWHERQRAVDAARHEARECAARAAADLAQLLTLAQAATDDADLRLRRAPPGVALGRLLGDEVGAAARLPAPWLPRPFELQALDRDGRRVDVVPGAGGAVAPPAAPVMAAGAGPAWQLVAPSGTPPSHAIALQRAAAPNVHGVAAYRIALSDAAVRQRLDPARAASTVDVAWLGLEADGRATVLATASRRDDALGRSVPGPLADGWIRAPGGAGAPPGPAARAAHLVAYQRIGGVDAPLAAACTSASAAVLADWHRRLPWLAAFTLLVAAGVAWGAQRLARATRELDDTRAALARSDVHLHALAGNLPDVVVRMDRQGRHLYVNPAVQRATGLPPEAFIGRTNAELGMPGDKVALWMATLARVFEHGKTERIEFDYSGPDGTRRWESLVTLEAGDDAAGRAALVISRDITERVQAETARDALRGQLVALLDGVSDGFVSLGRDWRYRYVNRKAAELLGREPADLIGKHIWTEFPEMLGQPIHDAYLRAMNEGISLHFDGYYAPWNAWFENRVHPSADGISIFFTRVTERVQAMKALRDSETRHRQLFESNPHPMWVYDLETLAFLAVNDAALRQYGYTRDEFLAMRITDIRPKEDVPRLLDNVARVGDGVDEAGVWRHLTQAGRLLEVEITSHTLAFDGRRAELVLAHDVTQRRQTERALKENEQRLRLALQAARQGLYDLDLRTGIAMVTPEYAQMLGHDPATFRESNAAWRERLHPDDRSRVERAFEDYVAGRSSEYRVEFRQRVRDDGWKWILSLGRIVERDAGGRPIRMLGTHTDIDAFKQAQSALAESQARMDYLLHKAPTVIYTAHPDGDYAGTYYSPTLEDMLGWTPEQFVQDPAFWVDHVHPDDRERVLGELATLPTRRDIVLEYRFADARGRWRWMRDAVTLAPAGDGRAGELVGSWIDITDRREAEDEVRRLASELEDRVAERTAQLAASEARYRTIFEAVPVAIGEEDWSGVQQLLRGLRARGITDGAAYFDQHPEFVRQCLDAVRIVRLNRKALALHDADDNTGAPQALRAFFPSPDDLSQFVGELEALWSGQRVYTARKSLPSLRGRPLSLMVSISLPALDDADAVALTCLVDITEVDRLNAELDRSLARLRQSNKELETFTYSVSHDLKAPLRGIDGYSRLLLSDHHDQLDDEGRRFLGHIRRATQHMGALIDDLLAYSRLERRELALTSVALDALVADVLEPFGDDFARDGVELCVDVPQGLRAQADAQGVAIALRNLVDNALKFSRRSRPPRIEVTAREDDGRVQIAVRDNGLGFDMKFHDRIFDIFQRLHRAEDYPGTGVGLAIVRKAMERMGGRVWAESEPGRGATFFIVLPRAA